MSQVNTTIESVRSLAFAAAVVLAIAVPVAMVGEAFLLVATGWTGVLGTHAVHDLVTFAVVWMGLLGLAVQLYRPRDRVTAILAMPVVMVPAAIIGLATGTELAMMGVVFGALGLLALALHPAGRSVLRFDRVASPNRVLVALFALGAAVLLAYGGLELAKQLTLADEHAAIQHYGNVAIAALYVVVMGALATVRRRDWRFAAWSAGFVALYLGLSSVVFPDVASSLGPIAGAFVALWAVAFVGTTERVRGRMVAGEPAAIEEPAIRAG